MTSPTEINTFTLENGLMTPSENQSTTKVFVSCVKYQFKCKIQPDSFIISDHVQSLPSSPQPDETSQVDKINVIVKCAGRSMNMDVFPLESISVLLKDACELAGKNPEKMKLTFDGKPS